MVVKIQHYKADILPAIPQPNSIYWIKASVDAEVSGYITDFQGVPYPLKDLDVTTEPFTTALKSAYDSAVAHMTNYSNPHQTTASQVGAYTSIETDNLLNDKVDKITGKGLSENDYTDSERKSVIATASTGVYSFTGLVKTSSTEFSIGAATGIIVDSGLNYQINYAGSVGNTTPFLTTANSTFVLLKNDSTILLQATFPTPKQRRENIYIGKIIHPDRTTILNVNNTVDFVYAPMSALRDLWSPLKLINDGIVVTPNGANLKINTSAGSLFGNGINYIADSLSPNSLSIPATVQSTFMYRTQAGGTFTDTTNLDPSYYDVAGVRTLIPGANARATNQRIYLFPTGQLRIQYGQVWYSSLTNAISGLQTESFIEYPNNKDNAVLIGIISIVKNATNLTDVTDAKVSFVSKFGELSGGTGGLSTTTLQQAYTNSITPEIETINGAVSLKQASGLDTDNVIEVLNGLGVVTASITGAGTIVVGTITPNSSAILQADSTTKGFLPPRMTNAQRIAISSPAIGLIVYCTDTVAGLYVYKSTGWTFII